MRRPFLLAALVVLVWAFPAQATPSEQPAYVQQHNEMLYPTVLIRGKLGSGSGTVIYSQERDGSISTFILTNFHVIARAVTIKEEWDSDEGENKKVERRERVIAEWPQYNNYSTSIGRLGKSAIIVTYDKARDLALLKLVDEERTVEHVARIWNEDWTMHLFEKVWAVGAGLGRAPFATDGLLALVNEQIGGYEYMLSTAPIIFGNSGGSLYMRGEDGHYYFVGVPSKVSGVGFTVVAHMAWSIPVGSVREFLRDKGYCYIIDAAGCEDDTTDTAN